MKIHSSFILITSVILSQSVFGMTHLACQEETTNFLFHITLPESMRDQSTASIFLISNGKEHLISNFAVKDPTRPPYMEWQEQSLLFSLSKDVDYKTFRLILYKGQDSKIYLKREDIHKTALPLKIKNFRSTCVQIK